MGGGRLFRLEGSGGREGCEDFKEVRGIRGISVRV